MSPDRRPDDFNEADANAPNPVVEALAIWRETWQATPVERWNRLNLWSTMRDAARALRLLAENDERAFCRGALEEVGFEAKKRRDLTAESAADAELVARLDDLIEASAASETAPTLAELNAVWRLPTSDEALDAAASDASPVASCDSDSRDSSADFVSRANADVLYGGAGVGRSFTDESGAIPKSAARPLEPGDVVVLSDDYEIKRVAGKGGQKAVYEVVSKRLGTRFAVKELLSELGGSEARRRDLEREVKIQARLQHQGIPKVFALHPDADPTSNGLPRFVETYVEGEPWSARPFDRAHFEENLDILLQVAKIMAYAHDRGVVHRDLKPENVMLGRYGELYVVDWGLAFDLNEEGPKTGAVGTQAYLPPEQALRRPVDKRADVFTLGGILYKILTGFAPYELAQRTQGNAVAGRKAAACDFVPLDPEAAKAELLKLAEEALASPDAAPELRDLAEKALFALASPSEILTFAEKGLVDVESLQYNYAGRRSGLEAQNALSALAKRHLFAINASAELRRLAQTALIALVATMPAKLLEILETALAEDVSQRFQNASAFVNALETHRPQSAALKRFQNIKQRFNLLQEALNVELNDDTRSKLARNIIESVELLNELQSLRPSVSFRSTNEIFSAFRDLFPNLDSRDGFFSDVFGSFNVESRTSALHPETESDVQLIQEIAETELKFRDFLIEKTIRYKDFMTATALVDEQREAIDFVFNAPSRESEKTTALQKLIRQEAQAKLAYEHVERGKIWSLKIVAMLAGALAILATLFVAAMDALDDNNVVPAFLLPLLCVVVYRGFRGFPSASH